MGSLSGFEDVNARFRAAMQDIGVSRTQGFVTKIVTAIKEDAATMTPVDTSFLANSAYSKTWRITSGWQAAVGYGAEYAEFVHEAPGTLLGTGLAWLPDAEPQFLAKAVKNVLSEDLQAIIDSEYRI